MFITLYLLLYSDNVNQALPIIVCYAPNTKNKSEFSKLKSIF